MKVYKFGGAAVNSAKGVRNLCAIVEQEIERDEELFIIVSAMGKTTNALEIVTEHFMSGNYSEATKALNVSREYHCQITDELFGVGNVPHRVSTLFEEVARVIDRKTPPIEQYDRWYDQIVTFGEMISTTLISDYMTSQGIINHRLDMRECFITDERHRDANVNIRASSPKLRQALKKYPSKILIGQGFIGVTPSGEPTTLGREGSDYSAAVAAYILNAESVTIWKDVDGILNADPRIFPDAEFIPEMTYLDAIELAHSGAQVIHPKTIKPLHNKQIPLYVRPFGDPLKPGSVIKSKIEHKVQIPMFTIKHNQVLLSIRPRDFSFVLEDKFAQIFTLLEKYRVKINLIQSSAVSLSLSVDDSRHIPTVVGVLKKDFRVLFNENLELLTIRNYTNEMLDNYTLHPNVYLTQRVRTMVRIVRERPPQSEVKREL